MSEWGWGGGGGHIPGITEVGGGEGKSYCGTKDFHQKLLRKFSHITRRLKPSISFCTTNIVMSLHL